MRYALNMLMAATSLATTALAGVAPYEFNLKTSHVMTHLGNIAHPIEWVYLDNNTRIASFDPEEWETFEQQAIEAGFGERSLQPSTGVNVTELHNISERSLAARGQSVTCYGSGSWARDIVLGNLIDGVCGGFAYGVAAKSVQILQSMNQVNEAGDNMSVFWKFSLFIAGYESASVCRSALNHLIYEACQGQHQDTRGGTIQDSYSQYGVDPTTDNCNC